MNGEFSRNTPKVLRREFGERGYPKYPRGDCPHPKDGLALYNRNLYCLACDRMWRSLTARQRTFYQDTLGVAEYGDENAA